MNTEGMSGAGMNPAAWPNLPQNVSCEYGKGANTGMGYIELKTSSSETSSTRNVRLYSMEDWGKLSNFVNRIYAFFGGATSTIAIDGKEYVVVKPTLRDHASGNKPVSKEEAVKFSDTQVVRILGEILGKEHHVSVVSKKEEFLPLEIKRFVTDHLKPYSMGEIDPLKKRPPIIDVLLPKLEAKYPGIKFDKEKIEETALNEYIYYAARTLNSSQRQVFNPDNMNNEILGMYLGALKQSINIDFKGLKLSDEKIEELGKSALKSIYDEHMSTKEDDAKMAAEAPKAQESREATAAALKKAEESRKKK